MALHDSFGDPRLVAPSLMPLPAGRRPIPAQSLPWLLVPAVILLDPLSLAWRYDQLSFPLLLLAVVLGACGAALLVYPLAKNGQRYGIGHALQCRSAWGARSAQPIIILRLIIVLLWGALFTRQLAEQLRDVLRALVSPRLRGSPLFQLEVPGLELSVFVLLTVTLLMLIAGSLAISPLHKIVQRNRWLIYLSIAASASVAVYAGNRSHGFGRWIKRIPSIDMGALGEVAAISALLVLPFFWLLATYVRQLAGDHLTLSQYAKSCLPLGLCIVFFTGAGGLISSALYTTGDSPSPMLAKSILQWGEPWVAGAAIISTILLWMVIVPFFTIVSQGGAWVALFPQWITPAKGQFIAAIMMALMAMLPMQRFLPPLHTTQQVLGCLVLPMVLILLVDQLWIRRKKMVIESLFHFEKAGQMGLPFRTAGLIAVGAGWLVYFFPFIMVGSIKPMVALPNTTLNTFVIPGGQLKVTAVIDWAFSLRLYGLGCAVLVTVITFMLFTVWGAWKKKPKKSKTGAKVIGAAAMLDSHNNLTSQDLTDPGFIYRAPRAATEDVEDEEPVDQAVGGEKQAKPVTLIAKKPQLRHRAEQNKESGGGASWQGSAEPLEGSAEEEWDDGDSEFSRHDVTLVGPLSK